MKKKSNMSVYIALLFLIFLVVVFPYKEGFDTITTTTSATTGNTTTKSYNFFDYYWPFSDTFLRSPDDHHKWLNSENGRSSSTEYSTQGNTNIDTRTNNTGGYNDVDYTGFNKTGTGNDGKRYKQSI
jgi:hypothetical protein